MNNNINFNDDNQFITEFKIFNDGDAGIVENVSLKITKKAADEDEKLPVYRLIATDANGGEMNEGFFYYESSEDKGFKNFQAQRLIRLAKGVLGDDVTFPEFNTPKEALDVIMRMVAKGVSNKQFRVAVCYGTTKKPDRYLRFKSFGRFIQPMSEINNLTLDKTDNTVRIEIAPTPGESLINTYTDRSTGNFFDGPIPSTDQSSDDNDLPF